MGRMIFSGLRTSERGDVVTAEETEELAEVSVIPEAQNISGIYAQDGVPTLQNRGNIAVLETPIPVDIPVTTPAYLKAVDEVTKPETIKIERNDESCIIFSMRNCPGNDSSAVCFLTFFSFFWDLVLLIITIDQGFSEELLLHAFVGVGLTLLWIDLVFNRIYISVTGSLLTKETKPMKQPRCLRDDKEIDIKKCNIVDVCCRRSVTKGDKGKQDVRYDVHLLYSDGVRETIIGHLSRMEEALYLQQEIERFILGQDIIEGTSKEEVIEVV
jgi:hypothetical protein